MLEVVNLCAGYKGRKVFSGLSFKLKPGDFLAVLGKNGSGKTTLLRALSATIPYEGAVKYNGRELKGMGRRELAKVLGIVEQNVNLVPLKAYEVVLLGRLPYAKFFSWQNEDFKAVENAMRKVGIWELRNRLITELSAGELQKVMIAKVFAQNAKILLLDEPTSHLDLESQIVTIKMLRQACKEGRIVISVFHDINLAKFASHILFMGENVLFGSADILTLENLSTYLNISAEMLHQYFIFH